MNIYEVVFSTTIFLDDDGDLIQEEDLDKIETGGDEEEISGMFHLGAYNIGQAFLDAHKYLDEHIGEGKYEVTKIKEKKNINIINWPDEDGDCQCVACRTERAAEEDRITFQHSCGSSICIIADGWDKIVCPNCQKEILRDRIIGSNGNYTFLNIDKDDKKGD